MGFTWLKVLRTLLGSHVWEKQNCLRELPGNWNSSLWCEVHPCDMGKAYFPVSHPLAWRKNILSLEVPSELSTGPVPGTVTHHPTGSTVKKASPIITHISTPHHWCICYSWCTGGETLHVWGQRTDGKSLHLPLSLAVTISHKLWRAGQVTPQCKSPASGCSFQPP